MRKIIELKVLPKDIEDEAAIQQKAIRKARVNPEQVRAVRVLRRSIDARQRQPFFLLRTEVFINESAPAEAAILDRFRDVSDQPQVIIVGAGPAGYFAALELIELGLKPILFDRGKDVQARRRDLRAIQQEGKVNPPVSYTHLTLPTICSV